MKIIPEILTHQKNLVIILAILGITIVIFVIVMTDMVGPDRHGKTESIFNQSFQDVETMTITESPENSIKAIWTYKTAGPVYSISISDDSQFIGVGTGNRLNSTQQDDEGRVYFFTQTGSLLWNQKPRTDKANPVVSVAVSDNGQYIAALNSDSGLFYFNKTGLQLWDDRSAFHKGENVAVNANGRYVAKGTGGGNYNQVTFYNHDGDPLWIYKTQDLQKSPTGHDFTGVHIALSADGQHIVAVSEDGRVYYFDTQNGYLLWVNNTGYSLQNVAMTPHGRYIAVASRDHNVYFFDDDGNRLWNYPTGDVVSTVAINEDGGYIAAGSEDSDIYLFDRDGTRLWRYKTGAPVGSVAMSLNGKTIVAGSDDHTIYCFNQTGSLLWNYRTGGEVRAVAVSGDGRYIAAGSFDGNVYFFNRSGTVDES
jgi:WD40 repeat protein